MCEGICLIFQRDKITLEKIWSHPLNYFSELKLLQEMSTERERHLIKIKACSANVIVLSSYSLCGTSKIRVDLQVQTSKIPFVGFVRERQGQRFLKLKCSGKQKGNLEQAEIILELQVLTNQEGGGRQIRNLILTNIRGAPPPWPP